MAAQRFCRIDPATNLVVNVELWEAAPADSIASEMAGPGWSYDPESGEFSPPAPPAEPVPDTVSDRQFFEVLANEGIITEAEALAYVSAGVIPKALADAIAQLPAAIQFTAKMQVIGANNFYRSAAIAETIGGLLGKTDADLDALWTAAAKL